MLGNCRSTFTINEPLVDARNRPAAETIGNAVYIGPTAVDLSPLAECGQASDRETQLIEQWREHDLQQFYREQRANRNR